MKRRSLLTHSASLAALATLPPAALAQKRKDSITLAMTLEPPGLDPTAGAASAIAEITQYNIFETLTKINADGKVTPLLAVSWEVSPDLRTYTFQLRKGVKFQNGEAFNAQSAKFSLDRAGGEKSTNKDKRTFASMDTVRAAPAPSTASVPQVGSSGPSPASGFAITATTAALLSPTSGSRLQMVSGAVSLRSWSQAEVV